MSIPEVSSKSRLLAFLSRYLGLKTKQPQRIHTIDQIALSASADSVTVDVNTVKALGKFPIQVRQTEDDGYGIFTSRSGSAGAETLPLIYGIDKNPFNVQPVLRVDQRSDPSAGGYGGTGDIVQFVGVPPWVGYLGTLANQKHFALDSRGAIGLSLGSYLQTEKPTYKIDMRVNSYLEELNFVGTGLNDMLQMGFPWGWETEYAPTAGNYRIEIDGVGATNTFKWSANGGSGWAVIEEPMTGDWQFLQEGLWVAFLATSGHTLGDYWDMSPEIVPPMRVKNAAGTQIFRLSNNGLLEVTDLDVSNIITAPTQPCVAAHLHSNQSITDGLYHPVLFDDDGTLDFDVGLDYDPLTGEFTAPADGKYLFMTNVWFGDVPSNTILVVGLRTTQSITAGYTLYSYEYLGGTAATWTAASFNTNPVPHYLVLGHWIVDMNAGEVGYIEARSTTTVAGTGTYLYGTTAAYLTTLYVHKLA